MDCPHCAQGEMPIVGGGTETFITSKGLTVVLQIPPTMSCDGCGYTLTCKEIKVFQINPHIPARAHDWGACFAGEEDAGVMGLGSTPNEAMDNLVKAAEFIDFIDQIHH